MAKKKNAKNKGNVKTNIKKDVIPKQIPIKETINNDAIAAALSALNPPVLLKVCRLCEAKDGPFLNIFDADRVTAKRIEEVMPFRIAENDDLPHKICFRCSAKLEELYEFIQRCIKTQESLRQAMGKTVPLVTKVKTRHIWEEKLNKSNITNDDICDALIKKAMEGIADIPFTPIEEGLVSTKETKSDENKKESSKDKVVSKDTDISKDKNSPTIDEDDLPLKKESLLSQMLITDTNKLPKRNTRRSKSKINEENKVEEPITKNSLIEPKIEPTPLKEPIKAEEIKKEVEKHPDLNDQPKFDIMDHVSMIKVNGVGVLFQCKLCNRNFLKKEVVMGHACAKNARPKVEAAKDPPPQEPAKKPVVKYITTKPESELKRPILLTDSPITIDDDDDDEDDKPLVTKKPKPKIGPASKVKKSENPPAEPPPPQLPSPPQLLQPQPFQINNAAIIQTGQVTGSLLQFPNVPSLNSRYKLVPGPNNTFSLVEESQVPTEPPLLKPATMPQQVDPPEPASSRGSTKRSGSKRTANNVNSNENAKKSQETSNAQPYPVGLFQTLPHNSSTLSEPVSAQPQTIQTPAMKKQSYTIVQTGNPSKLLISTKQHPPVEEVPKKKAKKSRNEESAQKQPFSVTLEDAAPPRDPGFFTFINVDPLLQPSYVLPTNNIIQESQISTSTNVVKQNDGKIQSKDVDSKYMCNMCNEKFSREKKLLAHIQLHYNKMDEEDQSRSGESEVPKRSRGRPKNSKST